MNRNELKAERIRQGKSSSYMGNLIGKSENSYAKKEKGQVKFTPDEMVLIATDLRLSPNQFYAIFFDSKLPFSNNEEEKL